MLVRRALRSPSVGATVLGSGFFGSSAASGRGHRLQAADINPLVRDINYAVRGEIVIRAGEIEKTLKTAEKDGKDAPFPFDKVIYCNIGNPQQLRQPPLSFHRQVLSLIECPELLERDDLFASDAIARARKYLSHTPNGTGPYCHSQGLEVVREEVVEFIKKRDGLGDVEPEDIFLTNGASHGVDSLLRTLIRPQSMGAKDGIMIPIPQYPLYSAVVPMYEGFPVKYYLDNDSQHWGLNVHDLQSSLDAAEREGISTRALVVINPGNPTGQVLSEDNMREVATFCAENSLVLMADEVYQENIYGKTPFRSFHKVVHDEGLEKDVQLVSFHSVSKGLIGECGKRGGYTHLHNIDPSLKHSLYLLASVSLCSNVVGQIMMGLMVNPPQPGHPSHDQYEQERVQLFDALARRAKKLVEALNDMEGVECRPANGAMYAFPEITLPDAVKEAASAAGKAPDMFYCLNLLEETGICVVPGSGFGQRDGTFHFRTTFLPPEEEIDAVIRRMQDFHTSFLAKYQ